MKGLDIAQITATIGLVGYATTGIFSSLFHKWKKKNSFVISTSGTQIIITENPLTNWLSNITYFFILTVFTFFVAYNRDGNNIYLQLFLIYLVSFVLAAINFYRKKRHIVVIDKATKTLSLKGNVYSFFDLYDFEIEGRNGWFSDDNFSYGLFLKLENGKRKLIFGYSVLKDIEKLKSEVDNHLSGL